MHKNLLQKQVATVDGQKFTAFLHGTLVSFQGDLDVTKLGVRPFEIGTAIPFENVLRFDGQSFLIHPEDASEFNSIVADLKPGHSAHIRLRLLSHDREVFELDAAGDFTVTDNFPPITSTEGKYAFLLRLSDQLQLLNEGKDIKYAVCRLLAGQFNVPWVTVIECSKEKRCFVSVDFIANQDAGISEIDDFSFILKTIERGDVLITNDTLSPDGVGPLPGSHLAIKGIHAALSAPIIVDGKIAGALVAFHTLPKKWTPLEAELIIETARRTGIRLEPTMIGTTPRDTIENQHNKSGQEQEITQRFETLKKLDRQRTKFFGNITHEFRTPLTLILDPLDDVIRKSGMDLPVRQRDNLLLVKRHAVRLQRLVNTLLDFSRFEAGQMDGMFQPTDIVQFTTELASNFRSSIEAAGLELVVSCDPIEDPVYLCRSMYEKIVLNLLSNAFKFTFEGKIKVSLRMRKRRVELRVIDTGVGIAEADIRRIFQRFATIQNTRSRTSEGTGIGLALVKEMVKMHGGRIIAKSKQDSGSEFIVRLPKGKAHLPAEKVQDSAEVLITSSVPYYLEELKSWAKTGADPDDKSQAAMNAAGLKPTVLVVDDNSDMRMYMRSVLDSRCTVLLAENGVKALQILDQGTMPEAIIADLMMPEMNGYELLATLKARKEWKNIPVILLTAQVTEEARIDGLHQGADDYMAKPFSSRELIARVDARVRMARLRNQAQQGLLENNKELEKVVDQQTQELKNSNEMLQRRNLELSAMNEELQGLTFAASHDLREPVRKLRFFIHRLLSEEDNLTNKGREFLTRIASSIQLLGDYISDMALYSSFNDTPPHITMVNLEVTLFTLKEFLKPLLDQQDVTLETAVSPPLPGDPEQVKQLVHNLVSNALKFRKPNAHLRIVIQGKNVAGKFIEHPMADNTKNYYELEVHDNGIGFNQNYERQIFQLFRKLHSRADHPGTGIGLTIVRKIMENHKGFVVAKSTLGLGASFRCYFPKNDVPIL
jgi:signal transduction histidine kinase